MSSLEIICLLSISIFGVPHGAFDYEFIRRASQGHDRVFVIMIAAYLTLVVFSFILWFAAPTFSILLFLLISTYHFGAADALNYGVEPKYPKYLAICSTITQGGAITILLPLLHWPKISQYFSELQSDHETVLNWLMLGGFFWAISALVVSVKLLKSGQREKLIAIPLICLSVWAMEPLLFFTLFFCCSHAWSHYRKSQQRLSVEGSFPSASFFVITVLAWILIAVVGLGLLPASDEVLWLTTNPSLLRGVFATLFALTVPHILVIDLLVFSIWRTESLNVDSSGLAT